MQQDLNQIIINFEIKNPASITKIETGHINDTYLVCTEGQNRKYVLQRINHEIFKNIAGLSNNILLVTKHIAFKIDARHKTQDARQLTSDDELLREKLELIETKNQEYFYKDTSGNYWRLYNFINNYQLSNINYQQIYKAGKAFGKFQQMLSDLPANQLTETIPNFHNMKTRYKTFLQTISNNPVLRVNSVQKEIKFVKAHIKEMLGMQELIDDGRIPLRVTHNDTKINNILFDESGTPVCIVDLDTVMPGSVLYDFGDAIRTAANIAAEDEADLSKVKMNIELFDAYTKGYIETAKSFLTQTEVENLALSAKFITFIMGLRFLTDYIDGDNYYKIHFENQNLQRTKAQFKLVASMDEQYDEMKSIVRNYFI